MSGGVDWNHPQLTDNYDDVLDIYIVGRDIDALTLQKSAPSNLPDGAMAYDRATDLFKEWDLGGSAFVNKKLAVAGGGTGADNTSQARTNLGLGSMAVQDSTAVAITGGSISGITLNASVITAGVVAIARGGTGASLALGTAGQVLQSNGAGVVFGADGSALINLNGSNISSGTISAARLPAAFGGMVQIQSNVLSTASTYGPAVDTATTLSVTITPASSSNRVAIIFCPHITTGTSDPILSIWRSIGGGSFTKLFYYGVAFNPAEVQQTIFYLDSPTTTSAVIYKLYINGGGASSTLSRLFGSAQQISTATAIELSI